MPDFSVFEKRNNITFSNKELLREAFTHRSYINEHKNAARSHNERLEFLGDAVLELIITEYLFQKYPEKTEGELTSLRAALVNASMLAETAEELGTGEFLLLSKGEAKDRGKARQYILANTFEALLGALYLDQGYDSTRDFISSVLFGKVVDVIKKGLWRDAKSFFQEMAQEKVGITPAYKVLKEIGPDHDKVFTVGVFLNDVLAAEGGGRSKQEAEQEAAAKALAKKGWKSRR